MPETPLFDHSYNPVDHDTYCKICGKDHIEIEMKNNKSPMWPQSFDAVVWTDEWLKQIKENPKLATDRGAMIGWFANAIMAGYDTAKKEPYGTRLRRA